MQFGFGSGLLWGLRNDIANATPIRFGALQDVDIQFSAELKELFGQNQFPLDVARGKHKITGKAKFANISAIALNALYFGQTLSTGQQLVSYSEGPTPIPTTPFQITVSNHTSPIVDMGVRNAATGQAFTLVASGPTAGQYSVAPATGIYTFSAADNVSGISVYIDYMYPSATTVGQTISGINPLMGAAPSFKAVFNQQYEGGQTTLVLNKCVATKLSVPTKLDDFVIQDFEFAAFADASNNVFSFSNTTEN